MTLDSTAPVHLSPMASLLSLPDEILLMIFGNLYHVGHSSHQQSPKKDVLSSRLVCRRMAGIGQELAFEHIDFLQDEKGIKRLLELSKSPLCRLVKRLSCYFEALDSRRASSVDAFRTWLRLDAFRTLEEVQEMFEAYCRESQYQCLLNRIGLDVAIPLGQFQSLRAVEMGVWRSRWYDAMSDDEFDRLCASSTGHRFFEAFTSSLARAGHHIEDLTLGYFHRDTSSSSDPSTLSIIQGLDPAHQVYLQAFGRLRRLKIALPMIGEDGHVHRLNFRGLSTFIQSAVSLEELWLSFCEMEDTSPVPSQFLRSLEIPHLRALVLNFAMVKASALLTFLRRHATTLKSIELSCIDLRRGSWEALCLGMREILTLESSSICGFGMYDRIMDYRTLAYELVGMGRFRLLNFYK